MLGRKKKKKIEDLPELEPAVPEEMIDMPDEKVDELNSEIEKLKRDIIEMKKEREPEEEIEDAEEEPDDEEPDEDEGETEVKVPPIVPKKQVLKKAQSEVQPQIIQVPVYLSDSEMLRRIDNGIQVLLRRGQNDEIKVSD